MWRPIPGMCYSKNLKTGLFKVVIGSERVCEPMEFHNHKRGAIG